MWKCPTWNSNLEWTLVIISLFMQLCYCNSCKNFTKKMLQINFCIMHFNAFQGFQNEILFQHSKISYNIKVNFGELFDILRVFWTFFLMLEGLLFSVMNLTLPVWNKICTLYGVLANCALQMFAGIYRDFAGKSECGDFKFMGIACIPTIPVIFEVNWTFYVYNFIKIFQISL